MTNQRKFGDELHDVEFRGVSPGRKNTSLRVFIPETAMSINGAEENLKSARLKLRLFCDPNDPKAKQDNGQQVMEHGGEIDIDIEADVNGYRRTDEGFSATLAMQKSTVDISELVRFAFSKGRMFLKKIAKVVTDDHAGEENPE